jgi:hypothetical protein
LSSSSVSYSCNKFGDDRQACSFGDSGSSQSGFSGQFLVAKSQAVGDLSAAGIGGWQPERSHDRRQQLYNLSMGRDSDFSLFVADLISDEYTNTLLSLSHDLCLWLLNCGFYWYFLNLLDKDARVQVSKDI